jgi:DNA-directed RNA polymerase specialized sigma24 family protein
MPDYPSSYPSYRFYADGRQVVVQNQAECDALAPGHAGSPAGPFPEAEDLSEASGLPAEAPQEETRAQARAMRESGSTQREIAEALGVSTTTVRRLLGEP